MTKLLTQPLGQKTLIFLPLPPSVNRRTIPIWRRGRPMQILSREARAYIYGIGAQLTKLRRSKAFKSFQTIAERTSVDCWFILPRTSCDAHNYTKILFDALEHAGFTTNDRYLIPVFRGEHYDKESQAIVCL